MKNTNNKIKKYTRIMTLVALLGAIFTTQTGCQVYAIKHEPTAVVKEEAVGLPVNTGVVTLNLKAGPSTEELIQAIEEASDTTAPETPKIITEVPEGGIDMYIMPEQIALRVGPDNGYDAITILTVNTKVHVIELAYDREEHVCARVEAYGLEGYVTVDALSYEPIHLKESAATEEILNEMEVRGNIGRLYIPSVGLDVALFDASLFGGAQPIVDRDDSAAYMQDSLEGDGYICVADHRHQGFDKIKKSVPGETIAIFDFGTHSRVYQCVDVFIGYNKRVAYTDLLGNDISGTNNGGLMMYTCNLDGTITITQWWEV